MLITTEEEHILNLIESARRGNTVRMIGIGNSMRPLLRDGRDFIYLVAVDCNTVLNKKDVIFYKSHEGLYVLHRINTVKNEGYYPNGDGNLYLEPLLSRDDIYLKAVGFNRNGRYISAESGWYRLYSTIWTSFLPIRGFIFKWAHRFKRVLLFLR